RLLKTLHTHSAAEAVSIPLSFHWCSDKTTFHKCGSENTNFERNCMLYLAFFGATTELSSHCVYCRSGFSPQTEILHSSVLFHAPCLTCVRLSVCFVFFSFGLHFNS
uniref:Uncharacterized protein n=1 Tax=Stegastes partitus TaxID=144197 RepID=A0A3B5APG1_9TELE